MFSIRQFIFIALCFAYAAVSLHAAEAPVLNQHSQNDIAINQGDKIKLSLQVTGQNLLYRWVRNFKTVCTDATCVFDSTVWGIGTQSLTVVVYNEQGSQSLTYTIKVMEKPVDHQSAQIEPPLQAPKALESVASDDMFVKARRGIGYSFIEKDIKVVAQLPRAIKWRESIRTHVAGIVSFGIKQIEEHTLSRGSLVHLSSINQRRVIKLVRGDLRSRSLSESQQPLWSIIAGDFLQIDGDKNVDVHLSAVKPDLFRILLFRGNARLVSEAKNGRAEVWLRSGEQILVDASKGFGQIEILSGRFAGKALRETSDQYFLQDKAKERSGGMFIHGDMKELGKLELSQSLTLAAKLLEEEDALKALEVLLVQFVKNRKNLDLNLSIAKCYERLGVYTEAFRFYKSARQINSDDERITLGLGQLFILARQWNNAVKELDDVSSNNDRSEQQRLYYLGVAYFNLAESDRSRSSFRASLWKPLDKNLEASAYEYLGGMVNNKSWSIAAGIRFGSDSNVYQWGSGERPENYKTADSLFVSGDLNLAWAAFKSQSSELVFGYDIERRYYLDSALKKFSPIDQTLYMTMSLGIGTAAEQDPGKVDQSTFRITLDPYLNIISLNDERSADIFGINLKMGLPSIVTAPYVLVGYESVSDPLPAFDDKVDPLLREPVEPSDRSAKHTQYGLGLNFIAKQFQTMDLLVLMNDVSHKSELISVDDFKETIVALSTSTYLSASWPLRFNVRYLSRAFAKSQDSRKDTCFNLGANIGYEITSMWMTDLDMNYTTQKSNREVDAFNRIDYSLGLGLKL